MALNLSLTTLNHISLLFLIQQNVEKTTSYYTWLNGKLYLLQWMIDSFDQWRDTMNVLENQNVHMMVWEYSNYRRNFQKQVNRDLKITFLQIFEAFAALICSFRSKVPSEQLDQWTSDTQHNGSNNNNNKIPTYIKWTVCFVNSSGWIEITRISIFKCGIVKQSCGNGNNEPSFWAKTTGQQKQFTQILCQMSTLVTNFLIKTY